MVNKKVNPIIYRRSFIFDLSCPLIFDLIACALPVHVNEERGVLLALCLEETKKNCLVQTMRLNCCVATDFTLHFSRYATQKSFKCVKPLRPRPSSLVEKVFQMRQWPQVSKS